MYKYPEFLKKEEAKLGEKVSTAVLSTTVKVKARAGRKHKDAAGDTPMAIDTAAPDLKTEESKTDGLTEEERKKKEEEEKKAAEPEPEF